jgi:hypothetical protein
MLEELIDLDIRCLAASETNDFTETCQILEELTMS